MQTHPATDAEASAAVTPDDRYSRLLTNLSAALAASIQARQAAEDTMHALHKAQDAINDFARSQPCD